MYYLCPPLLLPTMLAGGLLGWLNHDCLSRWNTDWLDDLTDRLMCDVWLTSGVCLTFTHANKDAGFRGSASATYYIYTDSSLRALPCENITLPLPFGVFCWPKLLTRYSWSHNVYHLWDFVNEFVCKMCVSRPHKNKAESGSDKGGGRNNIFCMMILYQYRNTKYWYLILRGIISFITILHTAAVSLDLHVWSLPITFTTGYISP